MRATLVINFGYIKSLAITYWLLVANCNTISIKIEVAIKLQRKMESIYRGINIFN